MTDTRISGFDGLKNALGLNAPTTDATNSDTPTEQATPAAETSAIPSTQSVEEANAADAAEGIADPKASIPTAPAFDTRGKAFTPEAFEVYAKYTRKVRRPNGGFRLDNPLDFSLARLHVEKQREGVLIGVKDLEKFMVLDIPPGVEGETVNCSLCEEPFEPIAVVGINREIGELMDEFFGRTWMAIGAFGSLVPCPFCPTCEERADALSVEKQKARGFVNRREPGKDPYPHPRTSYARCAQTCDRLNAEALPKVTATQVREKKIADNAAKLFGPEPPSTPLDRAKNAGGGELPEPRGQVVHNSSSRGQSTGAYPQRQR